MNKTRIEYLDYTTNPTVGCSGVGCAVARHCWACKQAKRMKHKCSACYSNMVERLHGTIRQRNKVMRGLGDETTAQIMMNGMRIYYNFIRPHTALDGKTPAQVAKIESGEAKWLSLIKKASQH